MSHEPPSAVDSDAVGGGNDGSEMEPIMVTLVFQTDQAAELLAVLSRYVVLTRNEPGCRNVDLVASVTRPGRLLIVEKWESEAHQQAHFDGSVMVAMAESCQGLLTAPPDIDLHEAVTMHDLN